MAKKKIGEKGQSVQLLFTMLLFFALGISALFTILFGARVYENIGQRMEANFSGVTALSYVANQVRQADRAGAVSVTEMEGTAVLKLSQEFDGEWYETLIYYQDGTVKELFTSEDSGLTLDAGIDIMDSEGMEFEMIHSNLLRVESKGKNGGSVLIGLRCGGE